MPKFWGSLEISACGVLPLWTLQILLNINLRLCRTVTTARLRFSTITALYKSTYLLTYSRMDEIACAISLSRLLCAAFLSFLCFKLPRF